MANNDAPREAAASWLLKLAPLERGQRLSQSLIWPLLRRYYVERGPDAWQSDGIPYFVTSNPRFADAYARVIAGLLRDLGAGADDGGEPVYIVELAAGVGRFGHGLLRRLQHYRRQPPFARVPVKYVMTDIVERNLDALAAHPRLRPFIDEGLLDLAYFDAEIGGDLRLRHSGEVIRPGTLRRPMVCIANYLFDSLPQDAFRIVGGTLQESLVTTHSRRREPTPVDPALLSRIERSFDHTPIAGDYYDDPAWNRLLAAYRDRMPEVGFLFPVGALRCVRHLQQLAGDRLLLLSGDKGYSDDAPILFGQGEPEMALHGDGCFSMMVDYQIIAGYVAGQGGSAQHYARPGDSLNISALSFGLGTMDEMRAAFEDAFEWFGADDAYGFAHLVAAAPSPGLPLLLAALRLSGWDGMVFLLLLPALRAALPTLSEPGRDEIRRATVRIWENYFPLDDGNDVAFALGTLLLDLGAHAAALEFFQHSVALHGMAPGSAFNTAMCAHHLGQDGAALQWLDSALELDPGLDVARHLRVRLLEDRTGGSSPDGE